MARKTRQVIKIDEELCNGCGQCVSACAEGAIELIDGKAKLVSDVYCDGLGACIGECPQGAITFEIREAADFDEAAVAQRLRTLGREPAEHRHHDETAASADHAQHVGHSHVCPSARTLDFRANDEQDERGNSPVLRSQLRQWPVKLILVNPAAPYFQDVDLLVAADCVPFAYASLHPDFLKGKSLVTGCPKFDDVELYRQKLTEILRTNHIKSVTVLRMEVPCCGGLTYLLKTAIEAAGKDVPLNEVVITLRGEIAERTESTA